MKGVGAGVFEYRIDFGPGYRVYFGKDGDAVVILLGAGRRNTRAATLRPYTSDGPTTRSGRRRRSDMPLTREFKETVQARLRADRKYRKELLHLQKEEGLRFELSLRAAS